MTSQVLEVMGLAKKTGRIYKELINQFVSLVAEFARLDLPKVRADVRQIEVSYPRLDLLLQNGASLI